MHRRNLILRRFGALSFGIGYYENGTWVDHTTLPDRGASLTIDGRPMAALHTMLECCPSPAPMPIRIDAPSVATLPIDRSLDVHAVARRSSAR
jgi:hypothetical protein